MKILIVRNFPSYMDVRRRTYNIQELGLAKSLVRMGNTCGVVFWTDTSVFITRRESACSITRYFQV